MMDLLRSTSGRPPQAAGSPDRYSAVTKSRNSGGGAGTADFDQSLEQAGALSQASLLGQATLPVQSPSSKISLSQQASQMAQAAGVLDPSQFSGSAQSHSLAQSPSLGGGVFNTASDSRGPRLDQVPPSALMLQGAHADLAQAMKAAPVRAMTMTEADSAAERNPGTLAQAASAKTGQVVTDRNVPWNKDWVFSGNERYNPELKPLFGGGLETPTTLGPHTLFGHEDEAAEQAVLKAMQAAETPARGQVGAPQAQSGAITPEVAAAELGQILRSLDGSMSEVEARDSSGQRGMPLNPSRPKLVSGTDFLANRSDVEPLSVSMAKAATAELAAPNMNSAIEAQQSAQQQKLSALAGPTAAVANKGKLHSTEEWLAANGMSGAPGRFAEAARPEAPVHLMSAPVTLGAGSQERLSKETLLGISQQIQQMSTHGGVNGGGEIRIRLKPENLGELHLKVVTEGNQVGLQVHASSESARRVIEESASALRDSLSAQNLSLSQLDVTTITSPHQASSDFSNRFSDGQQQAAMNMNQNRDPSGGGRSFQSQMGDEGATGLRGAPRLAMGSLSAAQAAASARTAYASTDGRIDVLA